eukprot:scaffold135369_cov46-Tisochrysis_lutea.AAC.1
MSMCTHSSPWAFRGGRAGTDPPTHDASVETGVISRDTTVWGQPNGLRLPQRERVLVLVRIA